MEARLLCVGDMHLGRRPSRVPGDLADHGVPPAELTPSAAWRLTVRAAIEREVDAVLLLGDVVDSERDFFEASGTLERGVRDLLAAGIEVFAVAGNHDIEVLPRLADQVSGLQLLGRRGAWEERILVRRGRPVARLLGWSFPKPHVHESPLASLELRPSELPSIGMLHCDTQSRSSRYAPVALADLERTSLDAWLLGHLHAPTLRAGRRPIGYLGSLQGLDPTETGPHGPWLLRVLGRKIELEPIPLAPLRWEKLDVSIEALDTADDLEPALARALRELHASLGARAGAARAVGCRVRLVGRSGLYRELRRRLQAGEPRAPLVHEGVAYFIEGFDDDAGAALDLEALARERDAAGILARKLLALRSSGAGAECAHLLAEARRALGRESDQALWSALDPPPLDDEPLRLLLERAGKRALEELLAQRGGAR